MSLEEANRGAEKHLSSAAEPQALSSPSSSAVETHKAGVAGPCQATLSSCVK